MNDPYVVLGVSRNASDEDIKKAYKELARKYHPDNYATNPLSDLADEKMKEINQAYDQIMNERSGKSSSYSQGGFNYSSTSSDPRFSNIRTLIARGAIKEAEVQLNNMPMNERTAEWHFLKGILLSKKGWVNDATVELEMACSMDPNNAEYASALNFLRYNGRRGFAGGAPMGGGCTTCDMCQGLICADCCCECLGGDLIDCC